MRKLNYFTTMKKFLYLLLTVITVAFTSCSSSDKDDAVTSSLKNVTVVGSSQELFMGTLTVTVILRHYTSDMSFKLYYGTEAEIKNFSSLPSVELTASSEPDKFSAEIPGNSIDKSEVNLGKLVATDNKTKETRVFNDPITVWRNPVSGL